jgi:hypothetical protein
MAHEHWRSRGRASLALEGAAGSPELLQSLLRYQTLYAATRHQHYSTSHCS